MQLEFGSTSQAYILGGEWGVIGGWWLVLLTILIGGLMDWGVVWWVGGGFCARLGFGICCVVNGMVRW